MRTRILILVIASSSALLFAGNPQSKQPAMTTATPGSRSHAAAKVTVQSSQTQPYDETAGPALMELHLTETFTGDLDGESPVRALQVLRGDHSANLVSVQRFRGTLVGREGTFVSTTGGSQRRGSSFPDGGPVTFPACEARVALLVPSEKAPTQHWIIGSNDDGLCGVK